VSSSRIDEYEISASIQPLDGRSLARLPEAQRTAESRILYTDSTLMNKIEELKRNADQVIVDGECWEVSTVENWGPSLQHQKCIIIKVTTDKGAKA
jgi:3-dehydroquinate synthase class II